MNNRFLINHTVSVFIGITTLVISIRLTEEYFDFNFFKYLIEDFQKLGSLVVFSLGMFFHEYLHRLGWGLRVTTITNHKKWLIPYCQCETPLERNKFILGLVLPLICLGLIPYMLGIVLNSEFFFFFSIIMIVPCVSDLIILSKMFNKKGKFKLMENQNGFDIIE